MSEHSLNQMPEDFLEQLYIVKADAKLRASFIQLLAMGSSAQQSRVAKLKEYLETQEAPAELLKFVERLENDQVAHQVLRELQKAI